MPRELDDVIEEESAAYARGFKEGYQSGYADGVLFAGKPRCHACSGLGTTTNKEAEWETCLFCGGKGVK